MSVAINTPVVDDTPQNSQFTPPDDLRVGPGDRELRKNEAFSKALDKATQHTQEAESNPKEPKEPKHAETKEPSPEKTSEAKPDPIAAKNAEDKVEKAEAKKEKPSLSKRTESLLKKDEELGAYRRTEVKEKKGKTVTGDNTVTDEEIEQELKTPKSEKSERRFQELHRRWKAAEAKEANTVKQLREKEERLALLEKQMQEVSSKASPALPEDIQKKLDHLQMLERQFELENSDHVKTTFDARLSRQEEKIYSTLEANGIVFKGMDAKQSVEEIKKRGGFRALARSNPDLVDGILDSLNVADRKEIEGAMMGQSMLEEERKAFIAAEKSKAKEYFAAKEKEAAETKVDPVKTKEAQIQAIDKIKADTFSKVSVFQDNPVPDDAPADEKKRISEENEFRGMLREIFTAHLLPANDQEAIDTALAATLAHNFKRQNEALSRELKALKAENERIKNGSKTSARNGVALSNIQPKAEKPASTFGASLDRAVERRGSA